MTTEEKKEFTLDTLNEVARAWHDGHDQSDALRQGTLRAITLETCIRRTCMNLVRSIRYVKEASWGLEAK
jgi:hypothetical protein